MAKRKIYRYPLYILARLGAWFVCLMPRALALRVARPVGALVYHTVPRYREQTLENLRNAFGDEKSEREIRVMARHVFENLAVTAAEILQFPKLTYDKIAELVDSREAFAVYDELLKEGKGLISITAHVGNWELLAGIFASSNRYRGAVLARRVRYEPFNRWIVSLRGGLGVRTIYRDRAGREIMSRLAQNECVGLLPDQDVDSLRGIFVDYFNRPAYTAVAPVKLALASGAPIICNFLVRKPDGGYRMVMGDTIRPQVTTTRDHAIRKYTQQWMRNFEKVIRKYPEQWAWMHNRWKTLPSERIETVGNGSPSALLASG